MSEETDFTPESADELASFMPSQRELAQDTLEKMVDYLRFIAKDPDRGPFEAEKLLTTLVQQGAIKISLTIKLKQVIDNPDAEVKFVIT